MRRSELPPALFADDIVLSEWSLLRPERPRVFSGGHPLIAPLFQSELFPDNMDALVLEVENLTDSPLCVGLLLSDNGNPPVVSSTGGREVLVPRVPARMFFPLESFASHGLKDPARKMRKIELLVRREHDCARPVLLEVAVSHLQGLRRTRPPGPRLTEEGLEQVLNRDPDEALGQRDLAPYVPENPMIQFPPPVFCYSRDRASRVISGRIMGESVGFPPDWSAAPNGELEWSHFLHRHHFLRPLVRLLARTGEQQYLPALEKAVTDWITQNPSPLDSDGGAGPAWETLSAAFRVREWLWLMGAAWNLPGFDGRVKGLMLRSLWEHARHLADYRGHPGNWRLLEAASLSLVGMLFPEFSESVTWREKGLERLERETSLQFFPDGMHFEISPLYHGLCVQACLEVFEAAKHAGLDVPPTIGTGLATWFRTLAALYRPNFTRPSINDSGGFLDHERALLRYAGATLELPDVLWTGSRGRRGHPPSEITAFFPDAGMAVVRSEYSEQGLYFLFRAGPPGAVHIHADSLSLELSVRGRPVLVDPGISRYAPSPLTRSYRHAGSHSTILLGEPQPPGRTLSFQDRIRSAKDRFMHLRRPGLEVVTGTRDTGVPTVTRAVALVAERFVVVRDSIAGTGQVEVRVHWQFAPGLKIRAGEAGDHQVAMCEDDKIMEFVFLAGSLCYRVEQKEGQTDPPGGFVAHEGRDLPAPRIDYIFTVDASIALEWVFLPSVPGEEWKIVTSGPGIIEFTPATGPGFSLDTTAWQITAVPLHRTSG
jgi:hypothetical protein